MNKFSKKNIDNKVSLMSSRFYAGRHTHTRIYTKLYSNNDYKNGHLTFIVQMQYFEIQIHISYY